MAVRGPRGATYADDVIESLTMLKGTSSKLELLDRTATAMDDMVKFLPKSVTDAEKAYINSMKDFMTIIADDLQFNNETVENLVKGVNDNKADFIAGPNATAIRPYPILSTLLDELREMRQVVNAIDTSIDVFDDYSTRDAEAAVKYSNFSSSSITGLGDTLSNSKRRLVDAYSITLEAMTYHGYSRANVEVKLVGYVGGKADIPVRDQSTGIMLPNPFDSFVRGANSNELIQALHKSTDLEIVAADDGAKLREFQALFETPPRYGETLLDYFSGIYDDIGFATGVTFVAKLDRLIQAQVDALYKKYQRRSKLGQAQKLLKADTFALLEATGKGISATFKGTGKAIGATAGAFIGGAAGAGVGTAQQAFPVARDLTTATAQALTGTALTIGGIVEAAGGAVFGTGQMVKGTFMGVGGATGIAARDTLIGAGYATGGFIKGSLKTAGGLMAALGGFLLGTGVTVLGVTASLGVSAGLATALYFKKRRELYKQIREDPVFIQNAIDTATAKQQAKLDEMNLAQSERERRALQLEADLLFLGAQRLKYAQKAAEAEQRANEAAAAAAEAALDTIETEIAALALTMEAEGMIREDEAAQRAFEREQGRLDREEERVIAEQERQAARSLRADTVADLQIDLKALNRKKISFENDHFGKDLQQALTPEMRRKYGGNTRQSAASRLVELENEIAAKKQEIRRLQGRP